jgi:hypothetical protein
MIRRLVVAVAAVCAIGMSDVPAQETAPSQRDPKAAAEEFLAGVRDGKIETAYDALMVGSPVLEQPQQYLLLKGQTQSQMQLFGKALDFEFLKQREVGSSLLILKYILRYEKDAMTWTFVFYRPKDQWVVTALRYLPSVQYLSD